MMLPDTDERVQEFLAALETKQRLTEAEITDSISNGASWPKCFDKHLHKRNNAWQTMLGKRYWTQLFDRL